MLAMLSLVFGSVLLIAGADRLVTGASALAKRLGLSQLVIGLTVVSVGTSTPELFVSAAGALQGKTDLAVGNVVGSNIGNILLILGMTGVLAPLAVNPRILSFDTPVMIAAAVMVAVLGIDGSLSRVDGAILLTCLMAYLWLSVRSAKSGGTGSPQDASAKPVTALLPSVVWLVVGLCLLGGGCQLVVSGAVELAQAAGLSELVIGLTIVAVGTSLPEIVTSILAARRGETDLSVGNIVGSNILNVLAILGVSSMLTSEGLQVAEVALGFDIPVMIGVSILAWPILWTHRTVTRLDAVILGTGYVLYVAALIMSWENQLVVRAWYAALTAYAFCSAGVITIELIPRRPKVARQVE
jgi:cation:H+ antiporter